MRNKLYKLALLLVLLSFVPFLLFVSKRETPPEKIKVPQHKTQTVENFVLKSAGKNVWELESPSAVLVRKDLIKLTKPVLTVLSKERVVIKASEALFDREKQLVYLKQVSLKGKNFIAFSPEGIYDLKSQTFKTEVGCKAVYNSVNTLEGKKCVLNLKSRVTIISNRVKTVIREDSK